MIRKATYTDISSILKITKACAKHMINKEIFQWNEHYPNKLVFSHVIESLTQMVNWVDLVEG